MVPRIPKPPHRTDAASGPGDAAGPVKPVVLGRIAGAYGVRGWVKIQSYTDPVSKLLDYRPWWIGQGEGRWRSVGCDAGRVQGRWVVAHLLGCDDRETALACRGQLLAVDRSQLPPLPEGQHYWCDLEGLRVVTIAGQVLGRIERLFPTGANDVIVVVGERERLIPDIPSVVKQIDLDTGVMTVDWDPDF